MALRYKFVELSTVTDEALEAAVNDWVARGWQLDGIRFVTTERSRRPAMAFVSFTRDVPHAELAASDAEARREHDAAIAEAPRSSRRPIPVTQAPGADFGDDAGFAETREIRVLPDALDPEPAAPAIDIDVADRRR